MMILDADNHGLVIEHASGVKPSAYGPPVRQSFTTVAATLVPPWGADTHDGYDIYAGNWPCDPSLIPSTPIGVHKASEGLGTYDAKFSQWVKTVAGRHPYRGAYHVIWPMRDGKPDDYIERQADGFLDFTTQQGVDWSQPGWFVQIDNEQFSGMPRIANVEEVRRFADRCIGRIGPKVSHYCNPVTDPQLFFAPELADLAKWEAQYNRNPSRAATVIRQWGGWVVNGIWDGRPVDANFIEKHDELDRVAGYVKKPDPPIEPTEVYEGDDDVVIITNKESYPNPPGADIAAGGIFWALMPDGTKRHIEQWAEVQARVDDGAVVRPQTTGNIQSLPAYQPTSVTATAVGVVYDEAFAQAVISAVARLLADEGLELTGFFKRA